MAGPALNDYEYIFGDEGFLLNADEAGYEAALPFFDVEKVTGLDSPPFRSATRDHEGVDGGYIDSEFMTMRTVTVEGTLYADVNDPETICDQLKADFGPVSTSKPFYYKHPNKAARVVFGKGQGARFDVDTLRRHGRTPCVLTLVCPDPYIYDADDIIGEGSTGSGETGHGFDHGYPLSFGGPSVSLNEVSVFNGGNHRAYPVVTIYGPIDNPSIIANGKSLSFDLTLGRGDYLRVDLRKRTVVLNDITSRRNKLVAGSKWWWVEPGVATSVIMTGGATSFTGSFTATAPGTVSTIVGNETDALDIVVGDKFFLRDSTGTLKEAVVFTVLSKTSGEVLNPNPNFEVDLTGWVGVGGTLTRDTTVFHAGIASAKMVPDGVSASAEVRSLLTDVAVTEGVPYLAQGWLRCAVARTVHLNVNWYDASSTYLSTSSGPILVAANTWTFVSNTFVAPATAAFASIVPTVTGTPAASDILWSDDIELSTGTTIGFTPNAALATATDDVISTGIATFTVGLKNTWY